MGGRRTPVLALPSSVGSFASICVYMPYASIIHMPPFPLGFLVLAVTCMYVCAIFVSLLSSFMVLYFTANR